MKKKWDNVSFELINKIEKHILKSGFPFEWSVRDEVIRANKILIEKMDNDDPPNEVYFKNYYIDFQEKKLRENDIAWNYFYSFYSINKKNEKYGIHWNYYFECKQSEKYNLIFFSEPISSMFEISHSINLSTLSILPDEILKANNNKLAQYQYNHLSNICYSYTMFPEGNDLIRSAIYQAFSPGLAEYYEHITFLKEEKISEVLSDSFLIFPVVVFSGNMFECVYSKNKIEIAPTKHIMLSVTDSIKPGKFGKNFIVDFVRADYLRTFLNLKVDEIINIIDSLKNKKFEITGKQISWLKAWYFGE